MTRYGIPRNKLGSLKRIGQGGQGIVYDAPGFRTKFTDSMVFKEYKPEALSEMDFGALSAMPALVEDTMSYEDAERLVAIAAWPCGIVEQNGNAIGQVMPAIPGRFTMAITTAKGTSQINAEIQHLLNHKSILTARGIELSDVQRFSLLREIAGELAFLHRNGICVGDISPKNLLFALSPSEATYFIDCDTMSVNGVSALPQVETPGWEVPEGEELATIYSDSYKLGLLALRLLVGDQDTRDPKRIPSRTPSMLKKLIRDSLTSKAERRPLPTAWTYILGHAIEEAQQRELDLGGEDEVDDSPTPPVPVVRSRPQPKTKGAVSTPKPAPTPPPAPPVEGHIASTTPSNDLRRRNQLIGAAIAVAAVFAVILVSVLAINSSDGSSTNRTARSTSSNAYDEPTYGNTRPSTSSSRTTADSGGSADDTTPYPSRPTTPPKVTLSAPPANFLPVQLDDNEQTCRQGISLGSGGFFATRGSENTTCFFAGNVGRAYVNANPPASALIEIAAEGSLDCADVAGNPRCTNGGRDFIMECGMRGAQRWVTCTGGNQAIVYIY